MLEKLKFVPMARPYASDSPISLFISTSASRMLLTTRAAAPRQIRLMNGQDRYAPERDVGGFLEFDPSPNT